MKNKPVVIRLLNQKTHVIEIKKNNMSIIINFNKFVVFQQRSRDESLTISS